MRGRSEGRSEGEVRGEVREEVKYILIKWGSAIFIGS